MKLTGICIAVCTVACLPLYAAQPSVMQTLDSALSAMMQADQTDGAKTVAVVPFAVKSSSSTEQTGIMVAEYAVSKFMQNDSYRIVERAQLEKVMQEIALSQTGLADESQVIEAGKMLVADRIFTGTVASGFGKEVVSARLIEVKTGEVLASSTISLTSSELQNFVSDIAGDVKVTGAMLRSLLVPGLGQFYTRKPVQGVLALTAVAGLGGATGYYIAQTGLARQEWKDSDPANMSTPQQQKLQNDAALQLFGTSYNSLSFAQTERVAQHIQNDVNSRKNDYDSKYDTAVLLGILTGAAWALNIGHAAVLASLTSRNVDLYFSSSKARPVAAGVCITF
ncbi:MAG: hypothetical protein GF398_02460 [Chitinivibrionales bacterium]|nr:hypothetical protein [Chitinivibrionales bacterium]